jgi:pimeloyl-ACP methyl ester carboxylesterase
MTETIKKPSLVYHLLEIFRAMIELVNGLIFLRKYQFKKIGNNEKIIVVPGLLSTDFATTLLRKFLNKSGFDVAGWDLGMNLGRVDSLNSLISKIEKLSKDSNQKIILIGWSMGGIFAREVAKKIPDSVARVITVGSPFANVNAPNWAKFFFDLLNKNQPIDVEFMNQLPNPAPMRTLALHSKSDGIVPWEACRENIVDELHENKEIHSCHFGMGMNSEVMLAIEEELSKHENAFHAVV